MSSDERGQALIETLLVGLLLLVPLIWLLGVLADMHRVALASTAAARDAGFAAARADSEIAATEAMDLAVATSFRDHGLDVSDAELDWKVLPRFGRGARFEVRVRYPVTIFQAPFLGRVSGPSVWIDARHSARAHPFISR